MKEGNDKETGKGMGESVMVFGQKQLIFKVIFIQLRFTCVRIYSFIATSGGLGDGVISGSGITHPSSSVIRLFFSKQHSHWL